MEFTGDETPEGSESFGQELGFFAIPRKDELLAAMVLRLEELRTVLPLPEADAVGREAAECVPWYLPRAIISFSRSSSPRGC